MCRFIAYIGDPMIIDELVIKPENSLIKQSVQSQDLVDATNGDGFGLGWYVHDIDDKPAKYGSIQPAWNDVNLQNLAPKIKSDCFFAHIRRANVGRVSLANCHPFSYDKLMFMHNGIIQNFDGIKRELRRRLDDKIYEWIIGSTDSEHFFALYLQYFLNQYDEYTLENMADALLHTINEIKSMKHVIGDDSYMVLNCVITDGRKMLAARYSSDPLNHSRSLYYNELNATTVDKPIEHGNAMLIASERLSENNWAWHEMPLNKMLLVEADLSHRFKDIH